MKFNLDRKSQKSISGVVLAGVLLGGAIVFGRKTGKPKLYKGARRTG
jgi:cobalt-zinc-cadmium efflux system membrane fusion protein